MKYKHKKVFSFSDVKYGWLLILSLMVFSGTLYLDLVFEPASVALWFLFGYGGGFLLAVLWGALNYIGHIRVHTLYKRNQDIKAFVEKLAMDHEEKQELVTYLDDYSKDLMGQGMEPKQARETAMEQFKIKEFQSLFKDTRLFDMHGHYYLLGYAGIAVLVGAVLLVLTNLYPAPLMLIVVETTIMLYSAGMFGLFFVYKLLDVLLHRKV